jgi:hypothetical protein
VFESIDTSLFIPNTIVDLDLRTSGIFYGKKSFLNLEINLYTDKMVDFKSNDLKNSIKNIIKNINDDNIMRNKYFNFSLTKK